jgi:hypothetical protein
LTSYFPLKLNEASAPVRLVNAMGTDLRTVYVLLQQRGSTAQQTTIRPSFTLLNNNDSENNPRLLIFTANTPTYFV